jgi:DNA-binding transcriptional regulator YiaG
VKPVEVLRADPSRLTEARTAARLSVHELARQLAVSRTAVQKWERAAVPADRLEAVCRALQGGPQTVHDLLALVSGSPGLPEARLHPHLAAEIPPLEAAGQLHRRSVTVQDAAGRRYSHVLLFPGLAPAVASREVLAGTDIAGLRQLLGLSQGALAEKLGVSRGNVAIMETEAVPGGRQDQLHLVFTAALQDLDLPAARARVDLGQAELARRIGKSPSTVNLWEKRTRPVPFKEAIRIGHVLAAAAHDDDRREVAAQRIVEAVATAGPNGFTGDDLVRLLASGRHRVPGTALNDQVGLARAVRDRRVHWRLTWVRNAAGGWRGSRRLHPGPLPTDDPQGLTGEELGRARRQVGASQNELATQLGTVWGTVSKWERRGKRAVPPEIAQAAIDALARLATARAASVEQDRGRLLGAVKRSPSCTRAQLLVDAGYGRATPRAMEVLAQLIADGLVHLRLTTNRARSYGTHMGVYPGPTPAQPSPRPGAWLRKRRCAAGLLQRELAAAAGVTQTAIGQWERSSVPALRLDDVETALAALPVFKPLRPAELRGARRAAHLTQAALGAALGVTQGAVMHWERVGVPRDRAQTVRELLTAAS